MEQLKTGKQIKNSNGTTYTVIAVWEDRALLVGGWDYVVINDLQHFEDTGYWGNGVYFPFFEDYRSIESLNEALYYLLHFKYRSKEAYE